MSVTFDASEIRDFAAKMRAGAVDNTVIADALSEIREAFLADVKTRTPERTGALKKAWVAGTTPNMVEITNPLPYAGYVERKKLMLVEALVNTERKVDDIVQKHLQALVGDIS